MLVFKILSYLKGGVWGFLKRSLKKYIKDNQIQLEIESAADLIFMEFKANKLYKYIDDIRERNFDEIVEYIVNNHTTNIKPKLNEIYSKKRYAPKKLEVIFAFFDRLSIIIVDIQAKYIQPELKVVIKSNEKTVQQSENKIINEIVKAKESIINHKESENDGEKKSEQIGILSINLPKTDSRIQSLISLKEKTLNLSEDFKDFYENYDNINWDAIQIKLSKFVETQVNEIKEYLLLISANYSVVYAFGKILGIKGANIALINRLKIWDKQTAQIKSIEVNYSELINTKSKILNLALSVGIVNIENQVAEYIDSKDNKIIIYYENFLDKNDDFWSLTKFVNNNVAEFIRKYKIKTINLFYKGPAELLFALGQLSNNWCECQIKEYNFLEKDKEKNTYFNGIKI